MLSLLFTRQARTLSFVAPLVAFAFTAHAQVCTPTEIQHILASDGEVNDLFGYRVAISDDVAAVVAWGYDHSGGLDRGTVYVFRIIDGNWVEEANLIPDFPHPDDQLFGDSVAIDNDVVVVGAKSFGEHNQGAALVFRFDGSGWIQEDRFGRDNDDLGASYAFGSSVDVSGNTIVIGELGNNVNGTAAGAAHVYEYINNSWVFQTVLFPSQSGAGSQFGRAVAIDGDAIIVSASAEITNPDVIDHRNGASYVFRRNNTQWIEEARLIPSPPLFAGNSASNGFSVDISGDLLITGSNSFGATVYRYTNSHWVEEAWLRSSDIILSANAFGRTVAIEDNIAIVGDPIGDSPSLLNQGSAHVFRYDGANWFEDIEIFGSDARLNDGFGDALAISGTTFIVGAHSHDDIGNESGAVYIFDADCSTLPCHADLTDDAQLNFFDVSAFLAAYSAADPIADFTNDGAFNFFDISAFLAAFAAGCP